MSSPSGFGLETLLEAAKFLEQQEQQKLQQQHQKQIIVVASGTSGIFESKSTGPPLLSAKVEALPGPSLNQEELPSAEDAKKPSSPSPSCYTNGIAVTTASPTIHHSPPVASVITPLSPALYNLPSTTTIINNTTHLTSNHITFTNVLHQRPLRKDDILLATMPNTHPNSHQYVERLDGYATHPSALLNRAVYPVVHMEDELMENGGEEGRLLTQRLERGSYTSSSSSSLAGSIVSTSPNGCQSAQGGSEMIKKRSGISGIREVHNKLEKNRRAHLKECFEILKRTVPPAQDEKKSSNLSILGSAIRYIQFLRRREREFEHEMERLAREKIHAQQRLAHLKKELSARWEHIDFNTLIPDSMEVDVPYDNQRRDASLLSYGKEPSYMDDEGGLVIVTNGHRVLENGAVSEDVGSASSSCELSGGGGGGAERVGEFAGRGGEYIVRGGEGDYVVREGESWKGGDYVVRGAEGGDYVVRGGEGESWRGGETLYSSSSSLSSTMSPLHHHGGLMTSQTQHIQVMSTTSVTSSSAHPAPPPSSHPTARLLPVTSSEPMALTLHTPLHNGGLKSSPPHHLSPSSASLSPLSHTETPSPSSRYPSPPSSCATGGGGPPVFRPSQQSTCQSSVIQSSGVNTLSATTNGLTSMPHVAAVFNGKTAAAATMNGLSGAATIIKSADNLGGGTAKLVSLNSLPPGLISHHHHNNQLVFTSQHPKLLPSTSAATPLTPLNKPLPSLQPISPPSSLHPHPLLPGPGAPLSLVSGARLLLPPHPGAAAAVAPSGAALSAVPKGKGGAGGSLAAVASNGRNHAAHGLINLSSATVPIGKILPGSAVTIPSSGIVSGIVSGIPNGKTTASAVANGLVSLSSAAAAVSGGKVIAAPGGVPLVAAASLKPAAAGVTTALRLVQK